MKTTKDPLKAAFLANMSHEIRTPLNAILGFTEELRDPNLTEQQKNECHEIIRRQVSSLTRLMDDILELALAESGGLKTEEDKFSLPGLLKDVVELFREKAESKGLQLLLREEPSTDLVVTDPRRLRQILMNLIGNAVKFTEKGRVEISSRTGERSGDTVDMHLFISDTGPGMTQQKARELFRPFTQGDEGLTRRFGGTGLGLALSQKLAKALGGKINLGSHEPGKGCTFVLSFPVKVVLAQIPVATTLQSLLELEIPGTKPLDGCRVLLVDDSPDNQHLIKRILTRNGAEVDIAKDGVEGVEKALKNSYKVVLMDIQMPRLDGYEATKLLRKSGYSTPIVALTAHSMNEDRERTKEAGCDLHLTKPVDTKSLLYTLTHLT